tara:strand:- start:42 stop:278 length:237 start_codon:yes stop_codon:yes gene_type:complete
MPKRLNFSEALDCIKNRRANRQSKFKYPLKNGTLVDVEVLKVSTGENGLVFKVIVDENEMTMHTSAAFESALRSGGMW